MKALNLKSNTNYKAIAIIAVLIALFLFVITSNIAKQPDAEQEADTSSTNNLVQIHSDKESIPSQTAGKQIKRVRSQIIHAETIPRSVTINGKTAAYRLLDIRAEIAGTIIKEHVRSGTRVTKGQILYSLDPADIPAQIAHQEADLELKKLNFKRAEKLRKDGLLSEAELAETVVALRAVEAELASLNTRLKPIKHPRALRWCVW